MKRFLFGLFLLLTPQLALAAPTVVYLTSGSSWTVPSDWTSSSNSIAVIGGGGSSAATGGGGGGAYSAATNISLTPGASVTYTVGSAGSSGSSGGDTYFNATSCGAASACAKGGGGATGSSGGAGGSASSGVGTTKFSGGSGGNQGSESVGGGGGGAAGPNGAGSNGGTAQSGSGGSAGGSGDAGYGGAAGSCGSPGQGGIAGSPGTEWDSTHGSGGGGCGGSTTGTGGTGGLYGGGGGGGGAGNAGASGKQGLIVVTYGYACAAHTQYATPSTYTYTVPSGIYSIAAKMWGAGGNGSYGGAGGYTVGAVAVSPSDSFKVVVGATNGTPGGGAPWHVGGGYGGGYSGLFKNSVTAGNAVLMAGGGGGGGGGNGGAPQAGAGGGLEGQSDNASHGDGGTQTSGGTAEYGQYGSQLQGGNAGAWEGWQPAGGAGGGWYGGGGGHSGQVWGSGGGGGSGYCGGAGVSYCTTTAGNYATPGNSSDTDRPAGVAVGSSGNGYVLVDLPPSAPTISGDTSISVNESSTYTFSGSVDPECDTIRYAIDWDDNGTVDEFAPSSGYVANGSSSSSAHAWGTSGTKTFKVRAQDSYGAYSQWASYTVTVNPIVTALITATPSDFREGDSAITLEWSSSQATSCTGTNFSTGSGSPTSGSTTVSPIATTTYTLACVGASDTASDSATVDYSADQAPSAPSIDGASNIYQNTPYSYSFTSVDPEADTLKYGVDWDNDGAIDEWVPSSGYVASGLTQSTSHTWANSSATYKALARDSRGATSGWTTATISCIATNVCGSGNVVNSCTSATVESCTYGCSAGSCSAPPAPSFSVFGAYSGHLVARPSLIPAGTSTRLYWNVDNAASCSVQSPNGDSWPVAFSGESGKQTRNLSERTTYTLTCTSLSGAIPASISENVTVNVRPTFQEK